MLFNIVLQTNKARYLDELSYWIGGRRGLCTFSRYAKIKEAIKAEGQNRKDGGLIGTITSVVLVIIGLIGIASGSVLGIAPIGVGMLMFFWSYNLVQIGNNVIDISENPLNYLTKLV